MRPTTKNMLAGMTVHFGEANGHHAQFITPEWTLELYVMRVWRQHGDVVEVGVQLVDSVGTVYATTTTTTTPTVMRMRKETGPDG